jgi:hypothetical protein
MVRLVAVFVVGAGLVLLVVLPLMLLLLLLLVLLVPLVLLELLIGLMPTSSALSISVYFANVSLYPKGQSVESCYSRPGTSSIDPMVCLPALAIPALAIPPSSPFLTLQAYVILHVLETEKPRKG